MLRIALAGLAIAAVLIAGAVCTPATTPSAAVTQSNSSGVRTGPVISPPPVTPPTPPGDNLPAFACKDATGGTASGSTGVTDVRVDEHGGYDRFVLQFDGPVPAYTVKRTAKPVFTQGASGQTITLSGTSGVQVLLHNASQSATYSGPTDFPQADFTVLKEARLTQDFEGTVSWGLGLGSAACMRVFALTGPARLVIDFQTGTS